MKLNKIFAIALAAITMTACSDDDDFNTAGDVTVGMQESELSFGEDMSAGTYYSIPVVVTGDANGPIQVTIEVQGTGSYPAQEGSDGDYIITSKTITIPSDSKVGNFEFYPIGDEVYGEGVINDDKQFIVTITNVSGAKIAENSSCLITLVDNEGQLPAAYEAIQGVWQFKGNESDEPIEFPLVCYGAEEGSEDYLKTVYFYGWLGMDYVEIKANISYDAAQEQIILSFPLGQVIAEGLNFGGSYGVRDIGLGAESGGYLIASGNIVATADKDGTEITFDPSNSFLGCLMNNGSLTTSIWFWLDNMSMTR